MPEEEKFAHLQLNHLKRRQENKTHHWRPNKIDFNCLCSFPAFSLLFFPPKYYFQRPLLEVLVI